MDGKVLAKAEKEEKIAYLEKIKQVVGFSLNTMVEARPAKIVAGLEPENTNRLIQLLAVAAKHCTDPARAVAMVRNGGVAPPSAAAPAAAPAAQAKEDAPAPAAPKTAAEPSAAAAAKDEAPAGGGAQVDRRDEMGAPSSSAMAKGTEDKGADDGERDDGDGAEPKKSMRPTMARRRPPKVKDNTRSIEPAGGGGAAPQGGSEHHGGRR